MRISSAYGPRVHPVTGEQKFHHGIDVAVPTGTPIRAPLSGKITHGGAPDQPSGLWVQVDGVVNGRAYQVRMMHLSAFVAPAGALVQRGEVIALSGATGRVTGPHIHLELRIDGARVDPAPYIG